MKKVSERKNLVLNVAFILVALGILLFLLNAPEETTARLPQDETHAQFRKIASKKEAEKSCLTCHDKDGTAPLAADHPPKYRCLFCHKRD